MSKPNLRGVTEEFWSEQKEDFKLYWSLASKAVAGILGFFVVTKTGFGWIDTIVSVFATGVPLLIIASQRALSKYPPLLRRRITRYSLCATLAAVTALGVGFYLAVIYGLITGVVKSLPSLVGSDFSPSLTTVMNAPGALNPDFIQNAIGFLNCFIVLVSLVAAIFNSFRALQIEELIHWAPKRGLFKYLVRRKVKAQDMLMFAGFEFGIIMTSIMFSSTVAIIVHVITMTPAVT
ncbi:hypothetical protein FHW83_005845 [Duganella sp. SG902]|uniref:hypothetical protein n=1 Tax=Duganella sp. SG902 TaxID=2587016 RepID=UPI00159CF8DB|nr:hypothetical protein [Duganella sp. SG902]NVM80001.1 hypothetical protein [Duganella sp. SG902]